MPMKVAEKSNTSRDSGCGTTIINQAVTAGLTKTKVKSSTWKTTDHVSNITFKMPLFHKHRDITWKAHVDPADHELCK